MAKEDQSKEELAVRSMRIVFNVERLVDGKLMEVKEVPAMLYEAQVRTNATVLSGCAARTGE
jgi:hypothetical protein